MELVLTLTLILTLTLTLKSKLILIIYSIINKEKIKNKYYRIRFYRKNPTEQNFN